MLLEITRSDTRSELREFIDVPWRIHSGSRGWVPPLRLAVRELLDEKRNPFYRSASRALFVARRNGRVVGRIAGIENKAHNGFHRDRVGFFGFFECANDPDAAVALFAAAEQWLTERGLVAMRGPMNPSTNYECGSLIEGFDTPSTFLTTWNPAYYADLYQRAAFSTAKDLLAYDIPFDGSFSLPPRIAAMAERIREKDGLTFRQLDLSRFEDEMNLCWEIYNAAWERNWGFIPMDRVEWEALARSLKPLIVPEFAFAAEVRGVPAGFALALPDFNKIFARIPNGRLLPTGLFKLLTGKKRLRSGRLLALGVKAEFRSRGIFAVFVHELMRRGREYGATNAEASWILEDNELLNAPLRSLGLQPCRRWRLYERPIGATS